MSNIQLYTQKDIDKLIENKALGLPVDFDDSQLHNILMDYRHNMLYDTGIHELLDFMRQPENFYYTCKWIFNVKLLPFQCLILNELWKKKFPMLIACRGASKCESEHSMLVTDSGFIRIGDLVGKDSEPLTKQVCNCKILGENGFNDIEYCWNNGVTDTIKIRTRCGFEKEGTYDHKIRIVRDGKIVWAELNDINVGDYVVIDRSSEWFPNTNDLDCEDAYVLGLLVGDGNYTVSGEKDFPKIVLHASKQAVASFISGLFDADGCVTKNGGVVEYSSKSYRLIQTLQFVLTRFGIVGIIAKEYNKKYGRYYYKLRICDIINLRLFSEQIGFRLNRKQKRLNNYLSRDVISNPNVDLLPRCLVMDYLLDIIKIYKNDNIIEHKPKIKKLLHAYCIKTYDISYKKLCDILEVTKQYSHYDSWKKLNDIYNKHYFYDKVVEKNRSKCQTFDVHIPNDHSFIAGGFISHNTFLLSIYSLLRAMFHQGCKIIVVGAAFRQSKIMFEFMEKVWNQSPILKSIVGQGKKAGPRRDIDRCTFNIGESEITAIPVGCLTGDTYVTTNKGIIKIGDLCSIKHGTKILSDGKFNDIGMYFDNGKQRVKKITTKMGYTYRGTYNHRMKVFENRKVVWKRTDEMQEGDSILIDNSSQWFDDCTVCSNSFGDACGAFCGLYDRLPGGILHMNKECVASFLREFFRVKNKEFDCGEFCTVSKSRDLLQCIQYVLLHYGVISCVSKWRDYLYKLEIHEDFCEQFNKCIYELKVDEEFSSCFVDEIVSIEDGTFENTYDLHVPANNEYIANGFFSHNSGEKIRGLRANYTIVDEFSCLDYNTLIPTSKGIIRIGNIVEKQESVKVLNDGGYEDIDIYIRTPTVNVYRVTTEYGYTIDCSSIHRFRVGDSWKRVTEIEPGDEIDIIDKRIGFGEREVDVEKYDLGKVHDEILLSNEKCVKKFLSKLVRSTGTYFCTSDINGKNCLILSIVVEDEVLANDIHTLLYYLGFIGTKTHVKSCDYYVLEYEDSEAFNIVRDLGIKEWYDVCDVNDVEKFIPQSIGIVKKVEKLDKKAKLYDFYLHNKHEFFGGVFVNHNSIQVDIFEIVIKGFSSVSSSPQERSYDEAKMSVYESLGMSDIVEQIKSSIGFGNQTVLSGTASYSFNHFYDYWQRYKAIIESRGEEDKLKNIFGGAVPEGFNWKDYSILRIPYTKLPDGFMDKSQISSAQVMMHKSFFDMEFNAVFATDSNGFFPRSLIESCVCSAPIKIGDNEVSFTASLTGSPSLEYIYGIDPASERDNFAIVILELHPDHRRVVYCWTIRRRDIFERADSYDATKISFYSYCVRKIRDLMKVFPAKYIGIDSQGGGISVIEAFHDKSILRDNEQLIWPYVKYSDDDQFWWEKKNKNTDYEAGEHILCPVNFANSAFISEANHGLKKDLEQKVCIFPRFDAVAIAESISIDKLNNRKYDTLEDCVMEIEEMKNELSIVVHSRTKAGREHWDVPNVKSLNTNQNVVRKDRYSALVIANMIARCYQNYERGGQDYNFVGGFVGGKKSGKSGQMYIGPGNIVNKLNQNIYRGIKR